MVNGLYEVIARVPPKLLAVSFIPGRPVPNRIPSEAATPSFEMMSVRPSGGFADIDGNPFRMAVFDRVG